MITVSQRESEVCSYSRVWPEKFDQAVGGSLYTRAGAAYLDFFSGAGMLNYGHNEPHLKRALIDYLERDGIAHGLDMLTTARAPFTETLGALILEPRDLDYKIVFAGPVGATAVEAALKLARKATGRKVVGCFDMGFHGVTASALSVAGNATHRASAGVPLAYSIELPYDAEPGRPADEVPDFDRLLEGTGELPDLAAVIVETVQGEGALAATCRRKGVLLIVDDIQMGCGRSGPILASKTPG